MPQPAPTSSCRAQQSAAAGRALALAGRSPRRCAGCDSSARRSPRIRARAPPLPRAARRSRAGRLPRRRRGRFAAWPRRCRAGRCGSPAPRLRLRLAARERGDRECRVSARAREPGRSPELAHEQPLPRSSGVAVPGVGHRSGQARTKERRPRRGACPGEPRRIAAGSRACLRERGDELPAEWGGELRRDRRQRLLGSRDELAGAPGLAERQRRLCRTEVTPGVDRRGPACGCARVRGRRGQRRGGRALPRGRPNDACLLLDLDAEVGGVL